MQRQTSYDTKFNISQLVLAGLLGIVIGGSVYISIKLPILPPYWFLAVFAGIILMAITPKRPDLVLLSIIFITSSIVNGTRIPSIDLGLRFFAYDLLVAALLGTVILKLLSINNKGEKKFFSTPLDIPLILFWAYALMATYVGFLKETGEPFFMNFFTYLLDPPAFVSRAIPEIRVVTIYLLFFGITNLLTEKKMLKTVVNGIFFLAILSAGVLILSEVFNVTIPFMDAKVSVLETEGQTFFGISRILSFTGEAIILISLVTKIAILLTDTERIPSVIDIFQLAVFATGVFITFHRNFYIAMGIAVLLIIAQVSEKGRSRLFNWSLILVIIFIAFTIFSIVFPTNTFSHMTYAIFERFASFFEAQTYEAGQYGTLRARDVEYQFAFPKIVQNPLTGLGLGANYRPRLDPAIEPLGDGLPEEIDYMHNAHVWIMTKTGIVGYVIFMTFMIMFIVRGFKNWRKVNDLSLRGVYLGFTMMMVGINFAAIVNPIFMTWYWAPLLGTMFGVNETILLLNNKKSEK
ncbi:MAG: O-antigen ligase family protein [Anaerolineales bacterium]|nr:O-antigen ligase family protein [Anaerolineales bacterium]